MAISKDLFLAILATDAYNRGYNESVKLDLRNLTMQRDVARMSVSEIRGNNDRCRIPLRSMRATPLMRTVTFALVLAVAWSKPAAAEQFTIECRHWDPPIYITFDVETKRLVWEVARPRRGAIGSITNDEVRFHVLSDPPVFAIWNRKSGSLYVLGVARDSIPNDKNLRNICHESELRPVMSRYDEYM